MGCQLRLLLLLQIRAPEQTGQAIRHVSQMFFKKEGVGGATILHCLLEIKKKKSAGRCGVGEAVHPKLEAFRRN